MISMGWEDLLFLHWPIAPSLLSARIPSGLELDLFGGAAWIAVVPFRMCHTRLRGLPPMPFSSSFPELNVRTYVRHHGRPGVWFFSLDAASAIAVWTARTLFHLPYRHATMQVNSEADEVRYRSRRNGRTEAEFEARYRPTGPAARSVPGSLEHWLTERYRLYSADKGGRIWWGAVEHEPWPLQPAEAVVTTDTMLAPLGLGIPDTAPLCHFARRVDVKAWSIRPSGPQG
jgi:uncharacterized protein